MRNDKNDVIVNKTIDFSLAIINYCEVLEQNKKFVIAKRMFLKHKMQKAKQISFIK